MTDSCSEWQWLSAWIYSFLSEDEWNVKNYISEEKCQSSLFEHSCKIWSWFSQLSLFGYPEMECVTLMNVSEGKDMHVWYETY